MKITLQIRFLSIFAICAVALCCSKNAKKVDAAIAEDLVVIDGEAEGIPEPSSKASEKVAATDNEKSVKPDCRSHSECESKVCSHYKKDNGFCAPLDCSPSERADNNKFYCDKAKKWQKSRREGEPCENSYECYESNCFMNPTCDLMPKSKSICKDGECTSVVEQDICAIAGMKRVLAKGEWMQSEDGTCMESLAQRVLKSVCVPCGNGVCDEKESICNCPEDCKE